MRSQRLTVATNFLPYQAVRYCAFSFPLVGNAHRAFRGEKHGRMPFGRATGKHKIDGTNTQCKFQSMQCPSVERTFCNRLYVYGRGRRRCTDPTIRAVGCCALLYRLQVENTGECRSVGCCALLFRLQGTLFRFHCTVPTDSVFLPSALSA